MITSAASFPSIRSAGQNAPAPKPPGDIQIDEKQAFDLVDKMVTGFNTALNDPQGGAQAHDVIAKTSHDLKANFKTLVAGATAAPAAADQGREAANQALLGGMVAGALDTLLMLAADHGSKAATPSAAAPDRSVIGAAIDHLLDQLQDGLSHARESLKAAGVETLQKASAEGKSMGEPLVAKAGDLADHQWSLRTYQSFEVGAFTLGYSLGITDGALISFGKPINPDQTQPAPPTPGSAG